MPKNPVRAARQASRQAIRTAKTAKRQDARAINTAKKVEKIATKTASKVAKIQGSAPKRAASEPMTKMESKDATKIAQKTTGPAKSTPRSMTEVAKGMKPAKKSGSKTPTPKQVAKTVMGASKKTADKVKQVVKGSGSSNSGSTGKKGLADGSLSKNVLDYSAREIAEGISNTAKTAKDAAYNKAKGVVDDVYNTAKRKAGYVGDAFDAGYNFLFKEKGGAVKKKKYQTGGMTPMKKVTPAMKSKNVGTKSTSSSSARPNMSKYKINPAAGGMKRGGTVKKYQAGGMTGGSKLAGTGNLAKAKAKSAVKLNSPSTINKMQTPAARKVATPGRINPMTGGMKKGGMVKRKK